MTTRQQLTQERLDALLKMIREDGATTAGESPPVEHLEALERTDDLGQPREVAVAHKKGETPPGWANDNPGMGNGAKE